MADIIFHLFVAYSSRAPGTFKKKDVKTSAEKNRQLQKLAEKSLGASNLRKSVMLPPGEDLDEWLAYNCTLLQSLCTSQHSRFFGIIAPVKADQRSRSHFETKPAFYTRCLISNSLFVSEN